MIREVFNWKGENHNFFSKKQQKKIKKIKNKFILKKKIFFIFKGIKKDVQDYINNCEGCIQKKAVSEKAPVRQIISSEKRERGVFDLTKLYNDPKTGDLWLLIMVNHFTKYGFYKPLPDKSAPAVSDWVDKTFGGEPFKIYHSDNGKEFVNFKVFNFFFKFFKIF